MNNMNKNMFITGICYKGIPDDEKVWTISENEKEMLRKRKIPKSAINRHRWVRRCKSQIDKIIKDRKLINLPMKYDHEGPKNEEFGIGIVADVSHAWTEKNDPLRIRFRSRVRHGKEEIARSVNGTSLKFFVNDDDNSGLMDEVSITDKPDDDECRYVVSESNGYEKDTMYGKIECITYEDNKGNIIYYEGNRDKYYPNKIIQNNMEYYTHDKNENYKLNNFNYINSSNFINKNQTHSNQDYNNNMSLANNNNSNQYGLGGNGNNMSGYPQQQFKPQSQFQNKGGFGNNGYQQQQPPQYQQQQQGNLQGNMNGNQNGGERGRRTNKGYNPRNNNGYNPITSSGSFGDNVRSTQLPLPQQQQQNQFMKPKFQQNQQMGSQFQQPQRQQQQSNYQPMGFQSQFQQPQQKQPQQKQQQQNQQTGSHWLII